MTVVEGGASSSKYRTLSFIVALVFLSTFLSYSNSSRPRLPTLPWSLFHRPSRFLLSPSSHSHRLPRHHDYKFKIGSAALRPDGVLKNVLTINGLFPAPTIEVMAGDTVSIEVTNGLEEGTSLHWHGLRIASQWDGAPGVSQCGIAPNRTFTYDFVIPIEQSGSYWYHSHASTQRADGLYGAFIIHPFSPPVAASSEIIHDDLKLIRIRGRDVSKAREVEDHVVLVGDWYHRDGKTLQSWFQSRASSGNEPVPDGTLVNGDQQYNCPLSLRTINCQSDGGKKPSFRLDPSKEQKLRLINTGSLAQIHFSVEDHWLEIIEADGTNLTPVLVEELPIAAGQRYAVILRPKERAVGRKQFVMHTRLDQECFTYVNSAVELDQRGSISYTSPLLTHQLVASLASPTEFDALSLLPTFGAIPLPPATSQVVLYATTVKRGSTGRAPYGYINGTSWKPSLGAPLLSLSDDDREAQIWDQKKQFIVDVDLVIPGNASTSMRDGATLRGEVNYVDIIINNLEDGPHPFHLHGHHFYPLYTFATEMGWGSYPWWTPPTLPTTAPALRDTWSVPPRGYSILRVPFDTPGMWLFHCHVLWHHAAGMSMLFDVGGDAVGEDVREFSKMMC